MLSIFRTDVIAHAHGIQHCVVDIYPLRLCLENLTCLKPSSRSGDSVEDSGEFALHIIVSSVTGLRGDRDHGVLKNGLAVPLPAVFALMELIQKIGYLPHF